MTADMIETPGRRNIIFGSVCSGIEAASVAWKPIGWRCAFMAEIANFPRAVLQHHYPDVPLRGDFTEIQAGEHEAIDVLVGGTPCQSFSVAGFRGGMADERGNLALEYLRLADRIRPRWLVWENVPGVLSSFDGRDFGSFLGAMVELGYGFAYRVFDAQYFHLAQRRERVFVVGHLGDWRRAAAVLFDRASLRGDSAPSRKAGSGAPCGTLAGTSPGGGWRIGSDEDAAEQLVIATTSGPGWWNETETAGALRSSTGGGDGALNATRVAFGGNNTRGPIDVATAVNAHGGPCGRMDFESETFVTHSLRGTGFDASEDGTGRGTPMTTTRSGVRRLTPRECERLQGFPDDYTLIPWRGGMASDGPRYQAIGNSMPVPVMRWIGARIARENT